MVDYCIDSEVAGQTVGTNQSFVQGKTELHCNTLPCNVIQDDNQDSCMIVLKKLYDVYSSHENTEDAYYRHCECFHKAASFNRIDAYIARDNQRVTLSSVPDDMLKFWNSFDTGELQPDILTTKCRACKECSCQLLKKAVVEQLEHDLMKHSVHFDKRIGQMRVKYLTRSDRSVDQLKCNKGSALAHQKNNNIKISRLSVAAAESYSANLQEAIIMGALEPFDELLKSNPEIAEYKQRFVQGGYSLSESVSSPVRPIWNQSAKNGADDISTNEFWLKAGGVVNLSRVFSFFRSQNFIACCDLRKAFYAFKVSLQDAMLSKVWLPINNTGGISKAHFGRCTQCATTKNPCPVTWSVYVWTSGLMGQIGSPVALKLCVAKAAQLFSGGNDIISNKTRECLISFSYFDDIV